MVTGLVRFQGDVEALALTLAALVPGVVEGLVGGAVVLTRGAPEGADAVADAMGATLARLAPGDDPWATGAGLARCDWLLCLTAGDVPSEGWIRAAERFLATAGGDGRRIGRLARPWRPFPDGLRRLGDGRLWPARIGAGDLVHCRFFADPAPKGVRVVRLPAAVRRDGD